MKKIVVLSLFFLIVLSTCVTAKPCGHSIKFKNYPIRTMPDMLPTQQTHRNLQGPTSSSAPVGAYEGDDSVPDGWHNIRIYIDYS